MVELLEYLRWSDLASYIIYIYLWRKFEYIKN